MSDKITLTHELFWKRSEITTILVAFESGNVFQETQIVDNDLIFSDDGVG